ncbi:dihydrolipoamide acetyltransferase family protein [Nesterenkonia ebinurensis]|uniref:dihydrolipoamide acetyltransferase family protein n=1 Tax=Nesterenkonia ebinurensis TaxID=2608252 RepID=UPI00168BCFE2|nr:dihydrolipoamide acetyltransferase family protein [Nesterenkonia ebinurensis]
MTTFNLPDLGEGLTEAVLLNWLVAEGDPVEVDQPIAEVETAKSAIEVPCPYAGLVQTLHGEVGETLEVDKPLITVTTGDDDAPSAAADEDAGALSYREEERAGTAAPEEAGSEGSGNVLIGYGTSASSNGRRRRRKRQVPTQAAPGETAPGEPQLVEATPTQTPAVEATPSGSAKAPRVSSPLVRKLAREQGVALDSLPGSGPDGLIMRQDVLTAAGASTDGVAGSPSEPVAAQAAGTSSSVDPDPTTGLAVRDQTPVTGIRKAIATKLSQSRAEIPEATVWQDIDVTALLDLRTQLKASDQGAPSVLAFLSRFVIAGLQRHPELNSRIDSDGTGETITQFQGVNLGFAAQTPKGLLVPVLRHAEQHSARALHTEIRRLAEAGREGTLSGKELSGGTFTVNNYGVFGSDGATPIINHPEAAILGIGRIMDRPWAVDGQLAVRKVTTLTLAFDHRVCDGGSAGGFLNYVATCMENPGTALADL